MPVILGSLIWAFAMIAAAYFLKGNPARDWVESALFVGASTFVIWKGERALRRR